MTLKTPCIKLCKLNEENVCVGCYRSIEEITNWRNLSLKEQKQVMETTKKRKRIKNYIDNLPERREDGFPFQKKKRV